MYDLGWEIDISAFLVGLIFLVIGNYLPKYNYINNYDVDTEKARKINRFIGYITVVMGLLFVISMFFSPISTVICLFLMIPYAVICVVYGIIAGHR